MRNFFITIDQGTTSSRAILYDHQIKKIDTSQIELTQHYPKDGWVEHDLQEIWHSVLSCVKKLIDKNSLKPEEIISIGITNQRETVAVWDRKTQEPLAKAIVWQDRRTAGYCEKLRDEGVEDGMTGYGAGIEEMTPNAFNVFVITVTLIVGLVFTANVMM